MKSASMSSRATGSVTGSTAGFPPRQTTTISEPVVKTRLPSPFVDAWRDYCVSHLDDGPVVTAPACSPPGC